jgi:hypothetical protein
MWSYIFMPPRTKKVVQTELEHDDYEELARVASSKNLTIKEAAREALRWWSVSNSDLSEDPLFKLNPVEFKLKIKSGEIESFLYGRK